MWLSMKNAGVVLSSAPSPSNGGGKAPAASLCSPRLPAILATHPGSEHPFPRNGLIVAKTHNTHWPDRLNLVVSSSSTWEALGDRRMSETSGLSELSKAHAAWCATAVASRILRVDSVRPDLPKAEDLGGIPGGAW